MSKFSAQKLSWPAVKADAIFFLHMPTKIIIFYIFFSECFQLFS